MKLPCRSKSYLNAVFRVCNPSEYIQLFQLRLSPEQSGKVEYERERLLGIANTFKNAAHGPLGGIEPIRPAIPVQRSNQLSYRGQLLSCNRKLMYI